MFIKKIMKKVLGSLEYKELFQDIEQLLSVEIDELVEFNKYEVRRHEVAESSEPICGIFYIIDKTIIPDHFSEYLVTEQKKVYLNKSEMYHSKFFKNYIWHKFPDLPYSEKYLPRGRVEVFSDVTTIYIDNCYTSDKRILSMICEMYRIKEGAYIVSPNYRCHVCSEEH